MNATPRRTPRICTKEETNITEMKRKRIINIRLDQRMENGELATVTVQKTCVDRRPPSGSGDGDSRF